MTETATYELRSHRPASTFWASISGWHRLRQTRAVLDQLPDSILSDIGIRREDLHRMRLKAVDAAIRLNQR